MSENPWFALRVDPIKSGTKSGSPDIILGGKAPDSDFTSAYETTFNATGNFDATNYVYVRARNNATSQSIGSVQVWAVRVGDIGNPSQWLQLKTEDGRNSTNIAADAGEVGVNGAPLIWTPGDAPPASAPWVLIAEIVGDSHPGFKLPATVRDLAGFQAWAKQQGRITCTIVQLPHVVPVPVTTFTWSCSIDLGNDDATTLAVGVAATSATPGGSLSYQLDKPDADGNLIGIGSTHYVVGTVYSQTRTVAADYAATLTITYQPTADAVATASFSVQVTTETDDGNDGGLGDTTTKVYVNDTVSFAQQPAQS